MSYKFRDDYKGNREGYDQKFIDKHGPSYPHIFELNKNHHVDKRAPPGNKNQPGPSQPKQPRIFDEHSAHSNIDYLEQQYPELRHKPIQQHNINNNQNIDSGVSSVSDIGDVEMGGMDLPGTGAPQGDNTSNNSSYTQDNSGTKFTTRKNVYKKNFQIVSDCIVSTFATDNNTTPNRVYLTSELLEIPWQLPVMYMTPSEYSLLNNGARAIKAKCKIIFRGCTVKFETNSTSTQVATLNTVQTLRAAVGLNKTGWGGQFRYVSFDDEDSMLPKTVQQASYNAETGGRLFSITQELYGLGPRSGSPSAAIAPCYNTGNFWIGRHYWCESSNITTQNIGWPTARIECCKSYDAKTMINKEIINEEYDFVLAPLKTPYRAYHASLPAYPFDININGNLTGPRVVNVTGSATDFTNTINTESQATAVVPSTFTFSITTPLEKSQQFRKGLWGQLHPKIQPSINVGVQAVPQLSALNYATGVYSRMVQASAYYDAYFELEVIEDNPTHFNYLTSANVPFGEQLIESSVANFDVQNTNSSIATIEGLIPNKEVL